MDFYSQVLLELMVALGGALFVANAFALLRRGADRRRGAKESAVRARPGSPVRKQVKVATTGTLAAAPLGRSFGFMLLGFVIAVWGIAASPADPMADVVSFAERFEVVRSAVGPGVFGVDPSEKVLRAWGLDDTADGLDRFVDRVLEAVPGAIGIVKPQSAFFERHGWQGVRTLGRLVAEARARDVLVVLDVKRGDVGSTNEGYAQAYLGAGAPIAADAITLTPYLGLGAMQSFFDAAAASGAGLFVVVRSSNPEGRAIQSARGDDGRSVEQQLLAELGSHNHRVALGAVGPFGAVFAPTHDRPADIDLVGMSGLFLAPGVGAQGATLQEVAACFADCPDRVLVSASRSLLEAGPDPVRLREALAGFAGEASAALAH